jgi:hypothetical protein
MMRAVIHNVFALAVCWFCAFASDAPSSAQVPAFEGDGPPAATGVGPFQSRLDRLAREYGVEPVASGHIFGGVDRETFLIRLGGGPDCEKQKTCLHVLFRNPQDNSPFVTFCAPGRYETSHHHTVNGMLLHIFEFVCNEKTKFQIQLSPDSALVASYIELD